MSGAVLKKTLKLLSSIILNVEEIFTFDSVLIATNDTNGMFNPPSFQFISVHKMLLCLVESCKRNRFPMIQLTEIYCG